MWGMSGRIALTTFGSIDFVTVCSRRCDGENIFDMLEPSTPASLVDGREHHPLACDWLSKVRSGMKRE
jgi:hypothetical protein